MQFVRGRMTNCAVSESSKTTGLFGRRSRKEIVSSTGAKEARAVSESVRKTQARVACSRAISWKNPGLFHGRFESDNLRLHVGGAR